MDSIFNPNYVSFEFKNFINETNLIERNTKIDGHSVSSEMAKRFVNQYLAEKYSRIPSIPTNLNNVYKGKILRNCFNKCKKFVLEDWVDYSEIECTLNCTEEVFNDSKILDSLN